MASFDTKPKKIHPLKPVLDLGYIFEVGLKG